MPEYDNPISLAGFKTPQEATKYLRDYNSKRFFGNLLLKQQSFASLYNLKKIPEILENYAFGKSDTDFGKNYIFIVGMPRTGKSTIEKLLHSSGQFEMGEENPILSDMFYNLVGPDGNNYLYPEYLKFFSSDIYPQIAMDINARLPASEAKPLVITMPHNFIFIPLLQKILPQSKIMWCDRPLKYLALNLYMKSFKSHFWDFTDDMNEIVSVLNDYQHLYNFYKKKMPNSFLSINYEDLLSSPKKSLRQIIDFLSPDTQGQISISKIVESNKGYLNVLKSENNLLQQYLKFFPEFKKLN
jgi:hypothetical protein